MNWVDTLLPQYKKGRKGLRNVDIIDHTDQSKVNSMVDSMTYSIDWMETGRQPDSYRGVDKRNAYRVKCYEEMDIIPDINEALRKEREPLYITGQQRKVLLQVFNNFSDRERQCYIMYEAEGLSMQQIAEKLGIKKRTVQQYIERAREKVSLIIS